MAVVMSWEIQRLKYFITNRKSFPREKGRKKITLKKKAEYYLIRLKNRYDISSP